MTAKRHRVSGSGAGFAFIVGRRSLVCVTDSLQTARATCAPTLPLAKVRPYGRTRRAFVFHLRPTPATK